MKVAHIRLSEDEFAAVEAAAAEASMSVSAFVRSLSLEGAGARAFLKPHRSGDHPTARAGHARYREQPQPARARSEHRTVRGRLPTGRSVDDARAVATTVAAELAEMTKRAAAARRGETG